MNSLKDVDPKEIAEETKDMRDQLHQLTARESQVVRDKENLLNQFRHYQSTPRHNLDDVIYTYTYINYICTYVYVSSIRTLQIDCLFCMCVYCKQRSANEWNKWEVATRLSKEGLDEYVTAFLMKNIDGGVFLFDLTDDLLLSEIGVKKIHLPKFRRIIDHLKHTSRRVWDQQIIPIAAFTPGMAVAFFFFFMLVDLFHSSLLYLQKKKKDENERLVLQLQQMKQEKQEMQNEINRLQKELDLSYSIIEQVESAFQVQINSKKKGNLEIGKLEVNSSFDELQEMPEPDQYNTNPSMALMVANNTQRTGSRRSTEWWWTTPSGPASVPPELSRGVQRSHTDRFVLYFFIFCSLACFELKKKKFNGIISYWTNANDILALAERPRRWVSELLPMTSWTRYSPTKLHVQQVLQEQRQEQEQRKEHALVNWRHDTGTHRSNGDVSRARNTLMYRSSRRTKSETHTPLIGSTAWWDNIVRKARSNQRFAHEAFAQEWTTEEVAYWLKRVHLEEYVPQFVQEHVNGEMLLKDFDMNMIAQHLKVKPLHCKPLMRHIEKLRMVTSFFFFFFF
ncbi:hypothetical protein RFI_20856 [Reticulomyxa filosa]|uniref:SAM domain-containing protein n=1 Tax=Reticulomyxa filosa TaxID=46433 RepID=X6MS44_RETFI|nr:hypothetical protein RFI_20856 [Reticulomyxa filosa]|eukprot:ETO16486.1 hypothetical protein RFI_20856 [Reticulomyxa filosa]